MSKPVCLVTAPVATRSGYGAHSRDIVHSLIDLDLYDIKIMEISEIFLDFKIPVHNKQCDYY